MHVDLAYAYAYASILVPIYIKKSVRHFLLGHLTWNRPLETNSTGQSTAEARATQGL